MDVPLFFAIQKGQSILQIRDDIMGELMIPGVNSLFLLADRTFRRGRHNWRH